MITTGTKLLVGSAVAAGLFAFLYGVTQGGTLGTIGLLSAMAGLALLAGINTWSRDSNVSAMDPEAFAASAAAQASARPSLWPLLTAIGATGIALGLATYPAFFILGLIALVAGAVEWMVQTWSERASVDRGFNATVRNVMIDPLELPVAGTIGFAVIVFAFSRVMLGLPNKSATVVAFAIVGALVLAGGTIIGIRRGASTTAVAGFLGLVAIVLIGGGTVAGLNGEREIEPHVTTGALAARNGCTAEETEADEHASQSLASKSNLAAVITYRDDQLSYVLSGMGSSEKASTGDLYLPRSNPNYIRFVNDSDGPARLLIDLHPRTDDQGQPLGPTATCTALVEEGGSQFLTVRFDLPSFAVDGGYAFTVPGSDASLGVVVP